MMWLMALGDQRYEEMKRDFYRLINHDILFTKREWDEKQDEIIVKKDNLQKEWNDIKMTIHSSLICNK